jgi:pimeloyl-ACP methyl ester carboxylesterase
MDNTRYHRRLPPWLIALVATAFASLCGAAPAAEAGSASVTLLVHGLKVDLAAPADTWSGMIEHLERSGHRFGGVVRPHGAKLQLPEALDQLNTHSDPQHANLFALEFSEGANVDGLAYKTLELAGCLAELRRYTGCQKVNLVAHSAGGLVARTYLQSALPGISYAGDVDRLITISTPHLGSALAEHLGDFLGTRATALKPGGELIRRLNDELDLPADVLLASIVVRGVGTRVAALDFPSSAYEQHLDREVLAALPIDYRRGGDQVVDVRSQNLRLARTASRYEAATGRPVLYLLARVADPSPADRSLAERSVHEAATSDAWTCIWVEMLLDAHRRCWSPLEEPLRSRWIELQASLCAYGIIEDHTARRHMFSEVFNAKVDRLTLVDQQDSLWRFQFTGRGHSRPKLFATKLKTTAVTGIMELEFDRFGRIIAERHAVE